MIPEIILIFYTITLTCIFQKRFMGSRIEIVEHEWIRILFCTCSHKSINGEKLNKVYEFNIIKIIYQHTNTTF